MPGLNMSVPVSPVMVIASCVVPPIFMATFPAMESLQPERVAEKPDIAGPQIVILVSNVTNIFVTIPGVTVRNHRRNLIDLRRRSGIHNWRRSGVDHGSSCHHHEGPNPNHPSTWLNDTATQTYPSTGRDGQTNYAI